MPQTDSNDYDRVAYPSMAHPQTFVDNLSIKGFLRGIEVARPGNCRVLELGCGDGFNLAAMAYLHPESHYTGVDYSTEAISRGRAFLSELGLNQVRLETADIRALDQIVPKLGQFDYILAHGVYSWVPPDVREALMATIDSLLAPNGVAFVSYLALPGAHMRDLVRTVIRFHSRGAESAVEKVQQSRTILNLISTGTLVPNHYTNWMKDELELINKHSAEALFHDELSDVSAPLLFTDFIGHASAHHLQFLSEAECLTPVSNALTDEAREQLRPLESNRVLLEQYLDFMEGRRFRQTLLCKPGLGRTLERERLNKLWIYCKASPRKADSPLIDTSTYEFEGEKKSELRASTPYTKAAMLELSSLHGEAIPFATLITAARERLLKAGFVVGDDFETELHQYFCRACVPGLVMLSWGPLPYTLTVPVHPCAHPLSRWLLRHDAPSVISYSGRFVEVNGSLGRKLLSLLDGTRDRAALDREMRDYLRAQQAEAKAKGLNVTGPSPDDPGITEQLERSLRGLAELGLFKRE